MNNNAEDPRVRAIVWCQKNIPFNIVAEGCHHEEIFQRRRSFLYQGCGQTCSKCGLETDETSDIQICRDANPCKVELIFRSMCVGCIEDVEAYLQGRMEVLVYQSELDKVSDYVQDLIFEKQPFIAI